MVRDLLLEAAIEQARLLARSRNRKVTVGTGWSGVWQVTGVVYDDDQHPAPAGFSVADILLYDPALAPWLVYPSGLALPADQINWIWRFPGNRFRLGSANQAWGYCRRKNIDPVLVCGVLGDEIHGTCVFVPGDSDDWRMVQAESFP